MHQTQRIKKIKKNIIKKPKHPGLMAQCVWPSKKKHPGVRGLNLTFFYLFKGWMPYRPPLIFFEKK